MSDKLVTACAVELLYLVLPKIDGEALYHELGKRCGNVAWLGEKNEFYLYAFPDYAANPPKGRIPPQIFLSQTDKKPPWLFPEEAVQQTWDWPEARQVVAPCRASLLLTDLMAQSLDGKDRQALFQNALESVINVLPPSAILWTASQHLVNPAAYLASRKTSTFHPLQYALNIRLYSLVGQRYEMLMDTLGMAPFGLPDLQVRFASHHPTDVARILFDTACALFDNEEIFQNGYQIPGPRSGEIWICHREVSGMKPDREVIVLRQA